MLSETVRSQGTEVSTSNTPEAAFSSRLVTATSARFEDRRFGDPRASERALATVQKHHGLRAEFDLSDDELVLVVEKVRAQHTLSRRELIDACFALSIELPDGDRLLDDKQATAFLLKLSLIHI